MVELEFVRCRLAVLLKKIIIDLYRRTFQTYEVSYFSLPNNHIKAWRREGEEDKQSSLYFVLGAPKQLSEKSLSEQNNTFIVC